MILMPPGSKATPTTKTPETYVPYSPPVGFSGLQQLLAGKVSPIQFIQRGLEAPIVSPVGGAAAVVSKTITKTTIKAAAPKILPLVIAGGAGLLAGGLLGGGGTQEQKQAAAQDTQLSQGQKMIQDTTQRVRDLITTLRMRADAKAATDVVTDVTAPIDITPTYQVTAGGDVDIGGVTTTTTTETPTITTTHIYQAPVQAPIGQAAIPIQTPVQEAIQIPIIEQAQEATQEGGMNWMLIAAIGIGAYLLLGRKKIV